MIIGFWNINKKHINELISLFCKINNIDIIGIAEGNLFLDETMRSIGYYSLGNDSSSKIQIFTKFNDSLFGEIIESERYILIELKLPTGEKIILSCCHLIDKYNNAKTTQEKECGYYIDEIEKFENDKQIEKTIVFGDFNANPFESLMVGAGFFNAINDIDQVLKINRKVKNRIYKFFYNPMWELYSRRERPLGTYHYYPNDHESHYWNILDNFIMRPAVLPFFDESGLKIISEIGQLSLLTDNGLVNKKLFSDHLPILANFRI